LHKGKISVYSPGEGLGSIFYLDLQCYKNTKEILNENSLKIENHVNVKALARTPVHTPNITMPIEKNLCIKNDYEIELKSSNRILRSGRLVGEPPRVTGPGGSESKSPLPLKGMFLDLLCPFVVSSLFGWVCI
jgi:hypothetical protein